MAVRFVNRFSAALAAGISSSETVLSFASGVGDFFRDKLGGPLGSDHVYLTLYNAGGDVEYVKVTATSGDDFTVVRGQDSTTARAWLADDMVACRPNAAALEEAVSVPTDLAHSGINLDITEMRGLTTPLSADQGGTSVSSLAALSTALGVVPGVDVMENVAPGTSGNMLTSNGTDWVSEPAKDVLIELLSATGTAPIYACRAWANFTGTTGALLVSGNISSITRNGFGDYTAYFATAMPSANYAVQFGCTGIGANGYTAQIRQDLTASTASAFRFQLKSTSGIATDPTSMSFSVFA